jgi:hypothetical protein
VAAPAMRRNSRRFIFTTYQKIYSALLQAA